LLKAYHSVKFYHPGEGLEMVDVVAALEAIARAAADGRAQDL
jgi:hypothetical protein